MFNVLDQVALWYTNWRIDREVKSNPEIEGFKLHKVEFDGNNFHAIGSFPGVVLLADEASRMLDASNCEHYMEFDMMPRLKKGVRPIRVTVQWAQPGLSPAQKAVQLEGELKEAYETIIKLQDQVKELLELSIKTVEEMTKEVNKL